MKNFLKKRFAWIAYLFDGETKVTEDAIKETEEASKEPEDVLNEPEDKAAGPEKAAAPKKKKRSGIDDEDPVSFRTATGPLTVQQIIYYILRDMLYASGPMLTYIGITLFCICVGYPFSGRMAYGFQRYLEEFSNPLMAVGVVLTLRHLYKRSKKRGSTFFEDASLYIKDIDFKKALLGLLFGAGAALFLSSVLTLIPKVWIFAAYNEKVKTIYQRYDIMLTIIESAVLTPLVEEIIFRGYMLNRLLKRWSDLAAMIVTTVIFSVMHGSSIWILYAFVMGWLIAVVSMREKNIIYGIFMHVGFNLPSVIQWFYYFMHPQMQAQPMINGMFRVILIGLTGLAFVVLCFRLYKKYYFETQQI